MSVIKNALLLTALIAAVTLMFKIGIANADYSAAAPEIVETQACADRLNFPHYGEAYACAHEVIAEDQNHEYETLLPLAQELNFHWIQWSGQAEGFSHPFSGWDGDRRVQDYTLTFSANSLWLETCNADQPASCVTVEIAP